MHELPLRGQIYFQFVNTLLCLVFGAFLIVGGWNSLLNNMNQTTPMLRIPMGVLQSVVVICGVMIGVTQVARILSTLKQQKIGFSLFAGAISTVTIAALAIAAAWQSETMTALVDDHLEITSTIVLFVTFGILLVIGSPIAIGLAFSGERIGKVIKPLLPIFGLQIVGLLLVTFVPAISMALLRLFGL